MAMSDFDQLPAPLATTFNALMSSGNKCATAVLVAALEVPDDRIRLSAVSALMKRDNSRGKVDLIRKLESLTPEMRSLLATKSRDMDNALRQCLLHGNTGLKRNALDLVRETTNYEQLPTLLQMLVKERSESYDLAAQTLSDLVNSLYDRLNVSRETATVDSAPDVQESYGQALAHLAKACDEVSELPEPEVVVEAVLALGDVDGNAVDYVCHRTSSECRALAGQLLLTSRHPGVMQLICGFMSKRYPHPNALKAFSQREDLEFVCHIMRWFPDKLTKHEKANFRQIESICWLEPPATLLELLPPGLQSSLVAFISSTGISLDRKLAIQESVVRDGTPEGRLAASAVLESMGDQEVEDLLFESLDAEDVDIQAWATSQLRSQNVSSAFSLLVQRLESPLPAVREAATNGLSDFNLECMLGQFDHFDSATCRRAADLLKKTDPDCIAKLRRELSTPDCRKRIRAAKAAQSMGLATAVTPGLLEMLKDHHAHVRRAAVEALGSTESGETANALQIAMNDPNTQVREAAIASLRRIKQHQETGQHAAT